MGTTAWTPKGRHQQHRLLGGLREIHLEEQQVRLAGIQAGRSDEYLGGADLPAQLLPLRFRVAGPVRLRQTGIAVIEITRTFQILENPVVVLGFLPGMGDEEPDGILLRHVAEVYLSRARKCQEHAWPIH